MGKIDLSGIYPPITTPFDSNGHIDFKKLEENLEKWSKIDFKGYVVLGSNGEFPFLTEKEKLDLVKFVKDHAGNKQVIVGSGCESTQATIDLCKRMEGLGVDACLIVTPCFFKGRMTPAALMSHFTQVANACSKPIILYNVPANTGVDMDVDTVLNLSSHPNIVGLKDSSGNIQKMYRIVEETADQDFQVLAGSAGYLLPALHSGSVGCVSALANCCGEAVVQLYNLFVEGKYTEARQLQARIVEPNAAVTRMLGVPALKHMLNKLGYYGGPVRSPLQPLTPTEQANVEKIFAKYGLYQ